MENENEDTEALVADAPLHTLKYRSMAMRAKNNTDAVPDRWAIKPTKEQNPALSMNRP